MLQDHVFDSNSEEKQPGGAAPHSFPTFALTHLEQGVADCLAPFWRKSVHPTGHLRVHGPLPAEGEDGADSADLGAAEEAL